MKTTELIGLSLNWAVETALGGKEPIIINPPRMPKGIYRKGLGLYRRCTSTSWRDGGPILADNRIGMQYLAYGRLHWGARMQKEDETFEQARLVLGPTYLIAAMRCFCLHQLGEEIELPQILKDDDEFVLIHTDSTFHEED